jgi:hypothetical protein
MPLFYANGYQSFFQSKDCHTDVIGGGGVSGLSLYPETGFCD